MKRGVVIGLLGTVAIFVAVGVAPRFYRGSSGPDGVPTLPMIRVAIMPVDASGGRELTYALMEQVDEIEEVDLVERHEIDAVFEELALSKSGFVGSGDALATSKLLGAEYMVFRAGGEANDTFISAGLRLLHIPTGRVRIVSGRSDDPEALADALKKKIQAALKEDKSLREEAFTKPVEPALSADDLRVIAELAPTITIDIEEQHRSYAVRDNTARDVAIEALDTAGFRILGVSIEKNAAPPRTDYRLTGGVVSDFGVRRGELVSIIATARLQIVDVVTGEVAASASSERISEVDLAEDTARRKAVERAVRETLMAMIPRFVERTRER